MAQLVDAQRGPFDTVPGVEDLSLAQPAVARGKCGSARRAAATHHRLTCCCISTTCADLPLSLPRSTRSMRSMTLPAQLHLAPSAAPAAAGNAVSRCAHPPRMCATGRMPPTATAAAQRSQHGTVVAPPPGRPLHPHRRTAAAAAHDPAQLLLAPTACTALAGTDVSPTAVPAAQPAQPGIAEAPSPPMPTARRQPPARRHLPRPSPRRCSPPCPSPGSLRNQASPAQQPLPRATAKAAAGGLGKQGGTLRRFTFRQHLVPGAGRQ